MISQNIVEARERLTEIVSGFPNAQAHNVFTPIEGKRKDSLSSIDQTDEEDNYCTRDGRERPQYLNSKIQSQFDSMKQVKKSFRKEYKRVET